MTLARIIRGLGKALPALGSLATTSPALACAVCGGGADDPTNATYLFSTILLSLVPLGAIGGTIFYLYRRARTAAAETMQVAPVPETDLRTV